MTTRAPVAVGDTTGSVYSPGTLFLSDGTVAGTRFGTIAGWLISISPSSTILTDRVLLTTGNELSVTNGSLPPRGGAPCAGAGCGLPDPDAQLPERGSDTVPATTGRRDVGSRAAVA